MSRQLKRALDREIEKLDTTEYNLVFTKRELTFIFNVLATKQDYRAGDGFIAFNLLKRIEPLVAEASHDIPEEAEQEKKVSVNLGEESN